MKRKSYRDRLEEAKAKSPQAGYPESYDGGPCIFCKAATTALRRGTGETRMDRRGRPYMDYWYVTDHVCQSGAAKALRSSNETLNRALFGGRK